MTRGGSKPNERIRNLKNRIEKKCTKCFNADFVNRRITRRKEKQRNSSGRQQSISQILLNNILFIHEFVYDLISDYAFICQESFKSDSFIIISTFFFQSH